MGFSATVTIEELTSPGPGLQPRTLTLRGTGLPFRGASWTSALKVMTTWYNGNGQRATQQVLGPQDPPSSWQGRWTSTQLAREPVSLVDENGTLQELFEPFAIREAFESIQRTGGLLRVTFAARGTTTVGDPDNGQVRPVDAKIVREGRCTSFETPINQHVDIGWTMQWEWVGRGGQRPVVSRAKRSDDLASAAADVEASIEAMRAVVEGRIAASNRLVRGSADRFTLGRLESISTSITNSARSFFNQLNRISAKFQQIAALQKKLTQTPLSIAGSAVDFAQNTQYVANQYIDQSTRTPAEVASLKSKVSDVLRAYRYSFGCETAASTSAASAYELEARTRRLLAAASLRAAASGGRGPTRAGSFLAVRVCVEGDTPQNVSQRYYGDPDHGADIMRANRLPWATPSFYPGQVLVIPELSAQPPSVGNGV